MKKGVIKYQGRFIQVTEEVMNNAIWERSYIPNGVIVFPINNEGKILLVEEKRPHETPSIRLKPLAGMLEDHETPEANAQREMQEEIGFKAEKMINYFSFSTSGTVNSKQYYFLAKNLIPSKLPNPDGEDSIISVQAFSLDEILELLHTEKMKWSTSTLGLWRLKQLIDKKQISLN